MRQRHVFVRDPVRPARRALRLAAAVAALMSLVPDRATAQATGQPPRDARNPGAAAAARQPATAASTPDQRFLRQLADYYEGLRTQAHAGMMEPAGHAAHGAATDPAALDAAIDARQSEVLRLLTSLYRDAYSPRALSDSGRDAAHAGMSGMRMEAGASGAAHGEEAAPLSPHFQRGVVLIEAARGRLRRPEVRALASRHRALLRKQLGGPTPTSTPSARPGR